MRPYHPIAVMAPRARISPRRPQDIDPCHHDDPIARSSRGYDTHKDVGQLIAGQGMCKGNTHVRYISLP